MGLARIGRNGKIQPDTENRTRVAALLGDLLAHSPEPLAKPHDLARRMARLTHIIRDTIVEAFERGHASARLRKSRGVYYTPEPVVSYIVRSVDHLLKTRFGLEAGLADYSTVEDERDVTNGGRIERGKATAPRVLILDPACGTGTFLYAVVDLIREQFIARDNVIMWPNYVRRCLLPRLFGFELLMAPYAVAHFKWGM